MSSLFSKLITKELAVETVFGTRLKYAVRRGDYKMVAVLLEKRMYCTHSLEPLGALVEAARHGYTRIINILLDPIHSISYRTMDFEHTIHQAAASGHQDLISTLLTRYKPRGIQDSILTSA